MALTTNNKLKKTPAIGTGDDLEPISLEGGLKANDGRAIISPVQPPVSTMSTGSGSTASTTGISGVTNGNKQRENNGWIGFTGGATGYGTLKDNDAFDRLTRRPDWYTGTDLPYGYVGYNYGGTAFTEDNYRDLTGAGAYERVWDGGQANVNMSAFLPQKEYDQARDLQSAIDAAINSGDEATRKQLQQQLDDITGRYGFYVNSDGSIDAAMVYAGDQDAYLNYGNDRNSGYSIPTFESRYDPLIQELYQAILNREPFTYDPETDETYQQYKQSYTRNGQRAMQDTLGQVSARTGGLASSYAASAAQQTYDNYMAALADKIPELKQLAYSMYQDELTNKRSDLSMLMDLDNTDYTRWADSRDFGYGVYRDNVSDSQWQQQFDYNAYRDSVSDNQWQQQFDTSNNQWQTEWDYNTSQDAWNRDYQLAQQYAELTGDYSGFLSAGWTQEQVNAANQAYQQQLAAAAAKANSSGGSSSSKKSSSAEEEESGVDWSQVEAYASQYGGDPETYIKANYRSMGFKSQTEALAAWEMYETMKDGDAGNASEGDIWTAVENFYARGGDPKSYVREHYKDMGFSSVNQALSAWQNHLFDAQQDGLTDAAWRRVNGSVQQMKANGKSNREIREYINQLTDEDMLNDWQLWELYKILGWELEG